MNFAFGVSLCLMLFALVLYPWSQFLSGVVAMLAIFAAAGGDDGGGPRKPA